MLVVLVTISQADGSVFLTDVIVLKQEHVHCTEMAVTYCYYFKNCKMDR
jgi:hypothetical protein